ncbi:type IV pilus modification protein PilV [Candidatus Thiodiazotropha sp. LNASS1]|uniref:type IV pilus modification protein PilV n=1 Tax=Candidatus Thiodiazotropha sp. LNASS1 TaxID=3096260 RepID=UPI0034E01B11
MRISTPIAHSRARCQGMTLIEVMVATVVIAIGLLGVAVLQVTALQGASNADYRSKAIDFASALSDRMHANLSAFDDEGVHDNAYTPLIPIDYCAAPPAALCAMNPNMTNTVGVSECNPTQMATYDMWQISCDGGVQGALPDGQLTVTCIDNDGSDADLCSDLSPLLITITWALQSEDNATEQVIMTAIPGAP